VFCGFSSGAGSGNYQGGKTMVQNVNYFDLAMKYYQETRLPNRVVRERRLARFRERIRAFRYRHEIIWGYLCLSLPLKGIIFCGWVGFKLYHMVHP
jgi:hypothetical protein